MPEPLATHAPRRARTATGLLGAFNDAGVLVAADVHVAQRLAALTGEADETVLLVSGHAWPVWEYYAPDLPAARIPPLEILDVNAVLDYGRSAELLREALTGYTGAWYVGWQDEVLDPMATVPLHLKGSGEVVPVAQEFWQLDVQHFTGIDAAASQS